MTTTLALLTSDPNLLRCQVEQIKACLKPPTRPPRAVGLGYFEADEILLRKKPGDVGSVDLGELARDVQSEVLFFRAGELAGGGAYVDDEDVMPLRARRWMFMHHGQLASPAATRAALARAMPASVLRLARGSTASELCLLTFLDLLRDGSSIDELELSPKVVGARLGEAARRVEAAERESGKVGSLGFFVTNGRVMAATRLGTAPLHYALLEGISRCPVCGLTDSTPDSEPLVRAHRRLRGVALACEVVGPDGFLEVAPASVVTVGHDLEVQVTPLGKA